MQDTAQLTFLCLVFLNVIVLSMFVLFEVATLLPEAIGREVRLAVSWALLIIIPMVLLLPLVACILARFEASVVPVTPLGSDPV
tara:strand:- start:1814 stop:2065 length:252 start_codon:yes stop_codon:yes gene_type:complete